MKKRIENINPLSNKDKPDNDGQTKGNNDTELQVSSMKKNEKKDKDDLDDSIEQLYIEQVTPNQEPLPNPNGEGTAGEYNETRNTGDV